MEISVEYRAIERAERKNENDLENIHHYLENRNVDLRSILGLQKNRKKERREV